MYRSKYKADTFWKDDVMNLNDALEKLDMCAETTRYGHPMKLESVVLNMSVSDSEGIEEVVLSKENHCFEENLRIQSAEETLKSMFSENYC